MINYQVNYLIGLYGEDGEDPDWTYEMWKDNVKLDHTCLGYWEWVVESRTESNEFFAPVTIAVPWESFSPTARLMNGIEFLVNQSYDRDDLSMPTCLDVLCCTARTLEMRLKESGN